MTSVAERPRRTPLIADFAKLRQDFPALRQEVANKPLAYLDNAASAQAPDAVIEAVAAHQRLNHANVHRGVHELSERATEAYERGRRRVREWINASGTDEIVFTRGTTESINLVAATLGRQRLHAGDEVLITGMEHHSNIVPWQLLCAERGAKLVHVPINDRGELELGAFDRLLTPRTKIVALVHVSNALGTVNPVAELVRKARAVGAVTLLDGAQAMPHMRVDVQALGCDFYAFSGHKMFAPTGIGVLYGRRELLDAMPPYQGGGEMILTVTWAGTTYNALPYKFEAGTPNVAGVVGLGAAIDYLERIDFDALATHEQALLRYATERLAEIPGSRVIGTARNKASVLSFVIDGIHAHDLGTIVDREGVAIRTGHHCAMPIMDRFGVPATARASFAFYNNRADVDRLISGLEVAKELFSVNELRELYREVILDHNRQPRNFGELTDADRVIEGVNPLCGDKLTLYVRMEGGRVADIRFKGSGCAISVASSSLMTERIKGTTVGESMELFRKVHDMLTGGETPDVEELDKLAALAGVREYPTRVKCASLAWHALNAALAGNGERVTTE